MTHQVLIFRGQMRGVIWYVEFIAGTWWSFFFRQLCKSFWGVRPSIIHCLVLFSNESLLRKFKLFTYFSWQFIYYLQNRLPEYQIWTLNFTGDFISLGNSQQKFNLLIPENPTQWPCCQPNFFLQLPKVKKKRPLSNACICNYFFKSLVTMVHRPWKSGRDCYHRFGCAKPRPA